MYLSLLTDTDKQTDGGDHITPYPPRHKWWSNDCDGEGSDGAGADCSGGQLLQHRRLQWAQSTLTAVTRLKPYDFLMSWFPDEREVYWTVKYIHSSAVCRVAGVARSGRL